MSIDGPALDLEDDAIRRALGLPVWDDPDAIDDLDPDHLDDWGETDD
jgi:hypothetical protein